MSKLTPAQERLQAKAEREKAKGYKPEKKPTPSAEERLSARDARKLASGKYVEMISPPTYVADSDGNYKALGAGSKVLVKKEDVEYLKEEKNFTLASAAKPKAEPKPTKTIKAEKAD